jgi:hypothetical protein
MASPSPLSALQPNPHVVSRRVGDGTVLVHLATNGIFELNETGARIWELLTEGCPTPADTISAEFGIDRSIAMDAIDRLMQQLQAAGLVSTR